VPAPHVYDYAVIRVAPRVEREEFINAGVIVFCRPARYLAAQVALDYGFTDIDGKQPRPVTVAET